MATQTSRSESSCFDTAALLVAFCGVHVFVHAKPKCSCDMYKHIVLHSLHCLHAEHCTLALTVALHLPIPTASPPNHPALPATPFHTAAAT
jgi:hypothetical protein